MLPSFPERCSRVLYTALWWLATPVVAAYLLWRSLRQPAYREGWGERFLGRSRGRDSGPCVWIHAVSVGETRAAAPLIEALRRRDPRLPILLTHMTPTGLETARALFGDTVAHAYLPYDYPGSIRRFLARWRPTLGIVMETEIWPNLMAVTEAARVPMVLANGRLSPRSLIAALRWVSLLRPAARRFVSVLAQSEADAARFRTLRGTDGKDEGVIVCGNLKFDIAVPDAQRGLARDFGSLLGARPRRVLLFASTREGEEERILDAWIARERVGPDDRDSAATLLVIVPRHPQRFDLVVDAAVARGLTIQRRSDGRAIEPATRVWLGDSMGELFAYYLSADVAYVGGSLLPLGGQNLIEAAAAGCPALIGPHTFNFAVISDAAVAAGAAVRVDDFGALIERACGIASDPARRKRMSEAGLAYASGHRGATGRTLAILAPLLPDM